MRASLDTNAIIHFYRADLQDILFDFFDEGVFIYDQIRSIELENHGQDILNRVDADIESGRIKRYTDDDLKNMHIFRIFDENVKDNRNLYGTGDLGEVYAIALAQTLGAYCLVTDDIKQGGPYMSLMQFEDEIMPFTFADILILRFLLGSADAETTVKDFDMINSRSVLEWQFKSHITRFIRRFWNDPYRQEDIKWMEWLVDKEEISVKTKFKELRAAL